MANKSLEKEIEELEAEICHCLADPKRIGILYALGEGKKSVGEVMNELGTNRATVSRHLRVLRECSMVNGERDGVRVYYSLADDRVIEALDLLRKVLASILAQRKVLAEALEQDLRT